MNNRIKDEGNFIVRYAKSFLHACNGIAYGIKYEHNIIIMILATIVVVTSMEMINSSIEATIDLVTTEIHPLAKIAKDTASAASLILCIVSFIGACIIFVPKIF